MDRTGTLFENGCLRDAPSTMAITVSSDDGGVAGSPTGWLRFWAREFGFIDEQMGVDELVNALWWVFFNTKRWVSLRFEK